MWNKFFWILIIIIFLLSSQAIALRINKPFTLTYPLTKEQIIQLNKYLDDLWNIQNGRQSLDIVTTTKTNAENGEIWLISTGYRLRLL